VRLDCITVGVYTNAAGQPGNAVFIIHGLYDPQAVAAVAKEEAAGEIQENNLDGVTVLQNPKGPPALIFPSNERAVLIVGDSVAAMPVAQTAAAVKKGQGDLDTNADLAALIKSVDTTSMLWAVAKVTDGLRQEAPDLAPFDTVTLAATRKDAVDSLKVVAVGSDAAKVRGLVDQAQGVIAGALAESRQAAQQQPAVKPAVDFLESVKIDVDGGRATGTATLRLKELLVLLETTFRSQPPARTVAPAQPQPVQPPQQRPGL
jgi:hypothetical protein